MFSLENIYIYIYIYIYKFFSLVDDFLKNVVDLDLIWRMSLKIGMKMGFEFQNFGCFCGINS
jgi:hypothetical protein